MTVDLRARVEALLSTGSPGGHDFLALPGGYLVCRDCLKLQTPAGEICLLCETVGQHPVRLIRADECCEGCLCTLCWQPFSCGTTVLGWCAAPREPGNQ